MGGVNRRWRPQIGLKLILVGLPLLYVPVLGYQYLQEMQRFVAEGQVQALRARAEAVATVLHGREDLFSPLAGLPSFDDRAENLYSAQLDQPVHLDGADGEWRGLEDRVRHFAGDHVVPLDGHPFDPDTVSLDLIVGRRAPHLYAWIEVRDESVLHRHPRYRRLDHSDHLRLTLLDADGQPARFVITAAGEGPVTGYRVGDAWRHPEGAGQPEPGIRGYWRDTASGYVVELRLAEAILGEIPRLRLEVADVDDAFTRRVQAIVGTWPTRHSDRFNRVLLPSPDLDRILRQLDRDGATIAVVDANERVRAEIGDAAGGGPRDPASAARYGEIARLALDGRPDTSMRPHTLQRSGVAGEHDSIVAAWPISGDGETLGAVVVEQRTRRILDAQRQALEQFVALLGAVIAAVAAGLFLFAWRLTSRIRRLSSEASGAIDPSGRVSARELQSEAAAGDALGELSRTFTDLLGRLAHRASWLEGLPRTLRHELSNPLNTLGTSLQNLNAEHPELGRSPYLRSAERGLARLAEIVEGMTDAASLEEALGGDDRERFDLAALLRAYVENVGAARRERELRLRAPADEVPIEGSDFRIEQLLDKLVDNAFDFSAAGTPIEIELAVRSSEAILRVANCGPLIPDAMLARVFDPMVSGRDSEAAERPHFGLGLYVVRAIAERHGGKMDARNRADGSGVELELRLPLAAR